MRRYKLNDKVTVISSLLNDMTDLSGYDGQVVGKKRLGGLLWYNVSVNYNGAIRTVRLLGDQIKHCKS